MNKKKVKFEEKYNYCIFFDLASQNIPWFQSMTYSLRQLSSISLKNILLKIT